MYINIQTRIYTKYLVMSVEEKHTAENPNINIIQKKA